MKETGIIMSGNHPSLIQDGTKTMTRRAIKPCSTATLHDGSQPEWVFTLAKCPYGQVGDRLWVRETFNVIETVVSPDPIPDKIVYKASPETYEAYQGIHWRPSIHMFRKDSRITLEITGLWAELLRSISPSDAMAEGGYTVEEFIKLYLRINHLPEDADPWNWALRFKLIGT